ncbi:3-hydroxyisobutyrate dehydrogenase [Actinokineospora diospyrosa]|uniref:3-hydroxyisobutyrate dehydrogenase n=1 Tax=Actinokineospora diospyrosa TaxID=103728 RepID=A0ABT1IMI7_9PSEU|nr:3-hydroxyisobutyrate dehydrogenase [Actinokineospora diospyrosa]MCP2273860.1 3-hydroxyisobutyrate dehydrogenase [Actinokineospora diospyrosa]
MSVTFLGLGNMGGPMAANLVKAGERVIGYDPVTAARAAADAVGITIAGSAVTAVAGADVVITMLPSGAHVLDCYREVVPRAKPGTLFLDCSTIDVADARAAAEIAAAAGHLAVDAPVSGGVVGAEAAKLTFMVGGPVEAVAAAEPYLRHMGARSVHCGDAGAGQATKICNNMILGISMIAVSEAFALGARLGLTDQALFDVASTASGQCWALTTNCPVPGPVPTSPANRDYSGGFASGLMLKDLRLAQAAARAAGVTTELGQHAADLYARFVDHDGPGRDFSAIITSIRDQDGTP